MNNLFKAGVAIGLGVTVGKYLGGALCGAMDGLALAAIEVGAKHGNTVCCEVLTKRGYEVKKKSEETIKNEISFHA